MKEKTKYKVKQLLCVFATTVMVISCVVLGSVEVFAASNKPAKVSITSVVSVDYNAVSIVWKKATNAKKYEVYRATSKKGTYKKIKTTEARSFKNTGLTTGKTYYYKVRAINGTQKGAFSAIKSVTPKLKKVNLTTVTRKTKTSIKLSWKKVNGAKGYQVYRATKKGGEYKKVKTTTSTSYTNTGLKSGKAYYYKVRAYRVVNGKNKYSAYSAARTVGQKECVSCKGSGKCMVCTGNGKCPYCGGKGTELCTSCWGTNIKINSYNCIFESC